MDYLTIRLGIFHFLALTGNGQFCSAFGGQCSCLDETALFQRSGAQLARRSQRHLPAGSEAGKATRTKHQHKREQHLLSPLPQLLIDPKGISVSGISSGADFAVQLQVAYSSLFAGVGVFAGQAYHCATHRFPQDVLQISNSSVPYCDDCPAGKTLMQDHCKIHPEWSSNVSSLIMYTNKQAAAETIDALGNLLQRRIFLYRGKSDQVFPEAAVKATADFFSELLPEGAVSFDDRIDSPHLLPGINPHLCWWEEWPGPDNCTYDGARHALEWIYGKQALSNGRDNDTENLAQWLIPFNQTNYFPLDGRDPLLDDEGLIFVPPSCNSYAERVPCKLHVFLHGCDVELTYPVFSKYGGFNEWAALNRIIVLYPKMSTNGNTQEQKRGCYDSYGQTGHDYDLKSGAQMQTIHNMVMALLSL